MGARTRVAPDAMQARAKPTCTWCGHAATITAYDYGDGVPTHWCERCRQLVRLGLDGPPGGRLA